MDTSKDGCRKFKSEPRTGEKVSGVYCVCSEELCNDGWVPDNPDPDDPDTWTTPATTPTTTTTTTTTTATPANVLYFSYLNNDDMKNKTYPLNTLKFRL